jgi:hypothetical protein
LSRDRGKVRPIHDTVGRFNAIKRVARNTTTLRLDMKEGCEQPMTDLARGIIIVAKPSPYWTKERIDLWMGECYHEVGHHAPEVTDLLPFMKKKKIGFDSLIGNLMNVYEDERNEMNNYGVYRGRDEYLSKTQAHYCSKGVDALTKHGVPTDPDKLLVTTALAITYQHRSRLQPDLALPAEEFNQLVDTSNYPQIPPMLDRDVLVTAQDVYNVVLQMLEDSPDHDPEEEQKKAEEAAKEESKGEGKKKKGKSGEEGGKSEGSEEEGEEGTSSEEDEVSYEDLMGHMHGEKTGEGYKGKIIYDHEARYDYKPWPTMDVLKARDLPSAGRHRGSTVSGILKYLEGGRNLAATARRLFQSVTQTRTSHNHKTGRLDKRDLYRVPSGSKDVFKRKEMGADPKGCALFLLTDASGSMEGTKFHITGASVALLNEACSPLGVPMKIAAFTEKHPNARHFVVKEFDERRTSDQIVEDYARIYPEMYQNADGESVMWAAKELMKRPEARKILIVLSDGCPSADNEGDCYTYTKDVIAHVHKWHGMELYGIGIRDDTVQYLYPEYQVLRKAEELEECLLKLIKRKIFV